MCCEDRFFCLFCVLCVYCSLYFCCLRSCFCYVSSVYIFLMVFMYVSLLVVVCVSLLRSVCFFFFSSYCICCRFFFVAHVAFCRCWLYRLFLSVCMSLCLSLSFCHPSLFMYSCVVVFRYFFLFMSRCLSVCMYVCMSVCLSVRVYVRLSVCVCAYCVSVFVRFYGIPLFRCCLYMFSGIVCYFWMADASRLIIFVD